VYWLRFLFLGVLVGRVILMFGMIRIAIVFGVVTMLGVFGFGIKAFCSVFGTHRAILPRVALTGNKGKHADDCE
jgi:hypothetical protein